MMRILLLALSLFLTFPLQAQEEMLTLELPGKKHERMSGLADDQGNLCIVHMVDRDIVIHQYLQATKKQSSTTVKPERDFNRYRFRGQRYDDHNFYAYFNPVNSQNADELIVLKINKQQPEENSFGKLKYRNSSKEHLLATINSNNQFYLLTYHKKEKAIYVKAFIGEGSEIQQFVFPVKKKWQKELKKSKFTTVKADQEILLQVAKSIRKVYLRPDRKLLLSVDRRRLIGALEQGWTDFLELDLNTGESTARVLKNDLGNGTETTNTLVVDDHLFKVFSKGDFFGIRAYKWEDFSKLYKLRYRIEDSFEHEVKHMKQKAKTSTSKILWRLSEGTPFITVETSNEGEYLVYAGTYIPPENKGGAPLTTTSTTGPINTPQGTYTAVTTTTYQGYGWNTPEEYKYFKMYLSKSDFSTTATEHYDNFKEVIADYKDRLKDENLKAKDILSIQISPNELWIGWRDKESKQLTLYKHTK